MHLKYIQTFLTNLLQNLCDLLFIKMLDQDPQIHITLVFLQHFPYNTANKVSSGILAEPVDNGGK